MCHPGKPLPQGESHCMRCFGSCFQSAKSAGWRFSGLMPMRAPAFICSTVFPESFPYPSNFMTSK